MSAKELFSAKPLSRRRFLRLSLIAAGAALVGCTQEPAATPQTIEKVVKETVLVEPTAPAEATKAPVELLFWNYWGTIDPYFTNVFEDFTDKYPWIKVKQELLAWDPYWQKLNTTLVTGTAPDVWFTAPTFYFEYVERKQLLDLTPLIEADGNVKEQFIPYCFHAWEAGPDKHIYGLSLDNSLYVMFYNKTLFDKYGVEYPTDAWTWDDYLEVGKALTIDEDGDGKPEIWGGVSYIGCDANLDSQIEANGGKVINEEYTKCLLADSTEAIETIQFHVDLKLKHKVVPPSGEWEGLGDGFAIGRAAMTYALCIRGPRYRKACDFDWDNALVPAGKVTRYSYSGPDGFVITAKTKQPEESWLLTKFLCLEVPTFLHVMTGLIPATRQGVSDPVFLSQERPPDITKWMQSQECCAWDNFGPGFNEWQTAKSNELAAAFDGAVSVEEAVQKATVAVDGVLARLEEERKTRG